MGLANPGSAQAQLVWARTSSGAGASLFRSEQIHLCPDLHAALQPPPVCGGDGEIKLWNTRSKDTFLIVSPWKDHRFGKMVCCACCHELLFEVSMNFLTVVAFPCLLPCQGNTEPVAFLLRLLCWIGCFFEPFARQSCAEWHLCSYRLLSSSSCCL